MKGILTVLLLIFTLTIYGQTAEEYLEKGIEKHEKQDFKGAIKEYSKAIKADESQLWYVVQGKTSLFMNFRAIKEAKIPTELQDKWIQFFKTARIVEQ